MRVLCHLAALISVKEDVVNIQRCGNKGLLVGLGARNSSGTSRGEGLDGPQAFSNRTEINVELDFVVLEGNQRKGKSRVAAEPEEKRNIEGGLRESIARSADLGRSTVGGARSTDGSEGRVGDVGELGGVANHLGVARPLLRGHGELVPDVHPITVLTVDALATNFNFNLGNQLLTREI